LLWIDEGKSMDLLDSKSLNVCSHKFQAKS